MLFSHHMRKYKILASSLTFTITYIWTSPNLIVHSVLHCSLALPNPREQHVTTMPKAWSFYIGHPKSTDLGDHGDGPFARGVKGHNLPTRVSCALNIKLGSTCIWWVSSIGWWVDTIRRVFFLNMLIIYSNVKNESKDLYLLEDSLAQTWNIN